MRRYFIRFENSFGTQHEVLVEDLKSDGADVVLKAGDVPFVTEMDGDSSPMMPVRYQTGELCVVQRVGDMLVLDDDDRYAVQLRVGNDVKWRGWLTCEAVNVDYTSMEGEVQYNLVDELGHIQTRDVRVNVNGMVSLSDLLLAICAGRTQRLWVGDGMPVHGDVAGTFGLRTAAANWKTENGDAKTLMSAIVDWMSFLGCTLMSDGLDWWVVSPEDMEYRLVEVIGGSGADAAGTVVFTDTVVAVTSTLDSRLYFMGSNQLSIEREAKNVSVYVGGADMSEVNMPKLTADACRLIGYGESNCTPSVRLKDGNPVNINYYALVYGGNSDNGIGLHRFNIGANGSWSTEYHPTFPTPGVIDSNYLGLNYNPLSIAGGAVLVKQDYWNTNDSGDEGSGTTNFKSNLEFEEMLYIVQKVRGIGLDRITDYQYSSEEVALEHAQTLCQEQLFKSLVVLRSNGPVSLYGGGLFINFTAIEHTDHIVDGIARNYSPIKYSTRNSNANMFFSLKIGDKWVMGNNDYCAFVDEEYVMNTGRLEGSTSSAAKYNQTVNNVTLKGYNDGYVAKGFCIKLPDVMLYETVELHIKGFGSYSSKTNHAAWAAVAEFPGVVQVSSLEFGYAAPFTESNNLRVDGVQGPNRSFYALNERGVDDIDLQTSLCSDCGVVVNTGMVYDAGLKRLNELSVGERSGVPERMLLERMKGEWFRTREMMTLVIHDRFVPSPQFVINHSGSMWRLLRVDERDWRSRALTATFLRIK